MAKHDDTPSSPSSSSRSTNGVHSNGQSHASASSSRASNGLAKTDLSDTAADSLSFLPLWEGSSIDKREFLRLTLQSLREFGFESSAKALEAESGLTLEHPSITAFRQAVLSGDWKNTERLLLDGLHYASRKVAASRGRTESNGGGSSGHDASDISAVLRHPDVVGLDGIKFMLQRQRYLELLETRQTKKALSVLRDRLTPLSRDTEQLHLLSSLVMCGHPEELHQRANWDGANGESRRELLVNIESAVSPLAMVPSRRLPKLLEQAQKWQKQQDPFFNLPPGAHLSLLVDHESDRSVFPSQVAHTLRGHHDEVWHLEFSRDGTRLATAGKDKLVMIWAVNDEFRLIKKLGPHSDPVSCVTWSHDDKRLLATSESVVTVWDTETWTQQTCSAEHEYTVGTAAWDFSRHGFVTGGMDGKIVFWDHNAKMVDTSVIMPFRVLAVAMSGDGRHVVALSNRHVSGLGAGSGTSGTAGHGQLAPPVPSSTTGSSQYSESPSPSSTSTGHFEMERSTAGGGAGAASWIDDLGGGSRRMGNERNRLHFYDGETREELSSVYVGEELISVSISRNSRYAVINKRPNEVQLWDLDKQVMVQRYTGHKVTRHVIRCGFGGVDDSFVVSGSEDSLVYVWHRPSGRLIETLRGHESGSVNAVSWHPLDQSMVASCGDDCTVRIWRPSGNGSNTRRLARRESRQMVGSDDSRGSGGGSGGGVANPFPWAEDADAETPDTPPLAGPLDGVYVDYMDEEA